MITAGGKITQPKAFLTLMNKTDYTAMFQALTASIDTGHAFVIGGQSDGHPRLEIVRQRMIRAFDVENDIIAGQTDLDQNASILHFRHEIERLIFIENVHAVADSPRFGNLHRLSDMKAQLLRANQAHGELAGVQRYGNFRKLPGEVVNHPHV